MIGSPLSSDPWSVFRRHDHSLDRSRPLSLVVQAAGTAPDKFSRDRAPRHRFPTVMSVIRSYVPGTVFYLLMRSCVPLFLNRCFSASGEAPRFPHPFRAPLFRPIPCTLPDTGRVLKFMDGLARPRLTLVRPPLFIRTLFTAGVCLRGLEVQHLRLQTYLSALSRFRGSSLFRLLVSAILFRLSRVFRSATRSHLRPSSRFVGTCSSHSGSGDFRC